MGIDNDSKLIFGITYFYDNFDINLFKTILKQHFNYVDFDKIDDEQIIGELLPEYVNNKYNINFIYTSPYFNIGIKNYYFHITYDIKEGMIASEIIEFISNIDTNILKQICEELHLEYKEPTLNLYPHIW